MEDRTTRHSLKSFDYEIVDVFAVGPRSGNQLAVVWLDDRQALDHGSPADDLQSIALEFGFSETVFVLPTDEADEPVPVRIFTPGVELPFAGHPTLGAAWAIRRRLAANGTSAPDRITLAEAVGPIETWFESSAPESLVWMSQNQPAFGASLEPAMVARSLGIDPDDVAKDPPVQIVSTGVPFTMVPLRTVDAVVRASEILADGQAPFDAAGADPAPWFVFAPGSVDPETSAIAQSSSSIALQFHARMFASRFGIAEDPATGSANGCFAAYLARYGSSFGAGSHRPGDGASACSGGLVDALVEQGYEIDRPSRLHLRAEESNRRFRIEVGGVVVPFATGQVDH